MTSRGACYNDEVSNSKFGCAGCWATNRIASRSAEYLLYSIIVDEAGKMWMFTQCFKLYCVLQVPSKTSSVHFVLQLMVLRSS